MLDVWQDVALKRFTEFNEPNYVLAHLRSMVSKGGGGVAMDGRPTLTDCDEAGDYVVPNVLSPRDLVFRPDNMDETVPHTRVQRTKTMKLKFSECNNYKTHE